jgi:WD40 repeat protein
LDTGQQRRELVGHATGVLSLAFSPDGKSLASTSWNDATHPGELMLWDVATGSATSRLLGPLGAVNHVTYGPEGRYLYTGHDGGAILVWRLESRPEPTSSEGAGG